VLLTVVVGFQAVSFSGLLCLPHNAATAATAPYRGALTSLVRAGQPVAKHRGGWWHEIPHPEPASCWIISPPRVLEAVTTNFLCYYSDAVEYM